MMTQPYNCYMSDGTFHRSTCGSAAEAIGRALDAHRGLTVAKCWVGSSSELLMGEYGRIDFEVPRHEPMPLRRFDDLIEGTTDMLFKEAEMPRREEPRKMTAKEKREAAIA